MPENGMINSGAGIGKSISGAIFRCFILKYTIFDINSDYCYDVVITS